MNHTLRSLTKSPGFTAAAVLTLALGIGANTAIFTIVNSVLLRPLPFPDSEQLVQIWQKTPKGEPLMARGPNFKYWRDEATLLDGIAALDPQSATATGGGEPERLQGYEVSASYLQVFRIHPLLGADFPADAYRVGGPNRLVIISHALWQSRFGGDPTVVNRPLRLDGIDYTIVGVLPPHALPRNDVAFLRPLVLEDPAKAWHMDPMSPWAVVVARMKPGVTPAQLSAEMSRIHTNHLAQFPAPARPFVGDPDA